MAAAKSRVPKWQLSNLFFDRKDDVFLLTSVSHPLTPDEVRLRHEAGSLPGRLRQTSWLLRQVTSKELPPQTGG